MLGIDLVLRRVKQIRRKDRCSFIQFDIDNFYPSISLELLNKAIAYAKTHTSVSDSELSIIMQARKTLLFHNGKPWSKKNDASDFDVPMGSYDGAEVCELVGTFMLSELIPVTAKNDIGLYRDDGLGITRNIGGPEIERRKKKIIQIFKAHKLNITINTNLPVVQYLDVEFDLRNGTYKPYKKPNNTPLYVNVKSNHPPTVLKHIPKGIAKRLSEISSSEEVFKEVAPEYEEALKKSGFKEKLEYCPDSTPRNRRRRRRIG